jgi:hypothetical protein
MVMILNTCLSSAWWCTPVIPVGKLRQEDQVFQVSLDCLGSKKREEEKKAERERERQTEGTISNQSLQLLG